jgi:FkbM family methyltransferase
MTRELKKIDIVLTVYNQEKLIERVLYGVFKNTTTPFNLILVFDGCTDKTKPRALNYINKFKPSLLKKIIIENSSNVFETRANNIGFKKSTEDYMLTLQDDMVINEFGWERRLTFPVRKYDDVIAVTSRVSQDLKSISNFNTDDIFTNQSGRELNNLPRNIFAVRDTINRGPVAFNMKHLRDMNFLNDKYAPSDLDDADLCLRAWKQRGLRCGAYWIDYISRLDWGKSRSKDSTMYADSHIRKNVTKIKDDHLDYIESQKKHSEDIIINENEIDYVKTSIFKKLYFVFYPMRLDKFNYKNAKRIIKKIVYKLLYIFGLKDINRIGLKKSLTQLVYPNNFKTTKIDNSFLLGVYNDSLSPTWRRMARGEFELLETKVIKKLIPFFENFVDVGGHIGYFTCLVGFNNKNANIIAFEPNITNFKSLNKNIKINNLKKVKVFNVGLSDSIGKTFLFGSDAGGSINTSSFSKQPNEKTEVNLDKLDNYICNIDIDKPTFIKIDIEASEYLMLIGGMKFLKSTKPIAILIEIVKDWSGGSNLNFSKTFDLIHNLGYKSFILGETLPLKETGSITELTGGNYLFIRNDSVELINKKLI